MSVDSPSAWLDEVAAGRDAQQHRRAFTAGLGVLLGQPVALPDDEDLASSEPLPAGADWAGPTRVSVPMQVDDEQSNAAGAGAAVGDKAVPKGRRKRLPVAQRNVCLQDRDRRILAWIVEFKVTTLPLLHRHWFGTAKSPETVNIWMSRMRRAGLMDRVVSRTAPGTWMKTDGGQALYQPTRDAHDLVASPYRLGNLRVTRTLLDHTLSVSEYSALALHQGWEVHSERWIEHQKPTAPSRAQGADRRSDLTLGKPAAPRGAWWTRKECGRGTHSPDLWLAKDGARVLVEIEWQRKKQDDYDDLLRGMWEAYCAGTLTSVLWVVPKGDRTITRMVVQAARKAVQPEAWGAGTYWDFRGPDGLPVAALPPEQWVQVQEWTPQYDVPYERPY